MSPLDIIWAIIALGMLIFVHELGHFLVAKLFGVAVQKFSLGFGPKVIGKKFGETEYLISVFPLGGYVKMLGEGDEGEVAPEDRGRSFSDKKPLQRIAIVAAGPIFNLVFACIVYVIILLMGIPISTSRIGKVHDAKPAARAGLKANDVIVSINGKSVETFEELQQEVFESKGKALALRVQREGKELDFQVVPEMIKDKNLLGDEEVHPIIGVEPSKEKVVKRLGPIDAISNATVRTVVLIKMTYIILGNLVQGKIPLDTIGGPVMIAKLAGEQAAAGSVNFLNLLALLSINLGVLNLLPIPILDGGHIVFNLWEAIFRKPVTAKAREIAQQVGLVLLLALMFLAFYNDIIRYFIKQG